MSSIREFEVEAVHCNRRHGIIDWLYSSIDKWNWWRCKGRDYEERIPPLSAHCFQCALRKHMRHKLRNTVSIYLIHNLRSRRVLISRWLQMKLTGILIAGGNLNRFPVSWHTKETKLMRIAKTYFSRWYFNNHYSWYKNEGTSWCGLEMHLDSERSSDEGDWWHSSVWWKQ